MPSCYECKTRAQGPWSSLHRLFPNNAASLEASAVMTVEKKRAAEISQRPAPALNEPRKLHCNPNCGSWASVQVERRRVPEDQRISCCGKLKHLSLWCEVWVPHPRRVFVLAARVGSR